MFTLKFISHTNLFTKSIRSSIKARVLQWQFYRQAQRVKRNGENWKTLEKCLWSSWAKLKNFFICLIWTRPKLIHASGGWWKCECFSNSLLVCNYLVRIQAGQSFSFVHHYFWNNLTSQNVLHANKRFSHVDRTKIISAKDCNTECKIYAWEVLMTSNELISIHSFIRSFPVFEWTVFYNEQTSALSLLSQYLDLLSS